MLSVLLELGENDWCKIRSDDLGNLILAVGNEPFSHEHILVIDAETWPTFVRTVESLMGW